MNWKAHVKRWVAPSVLNETLLRLPLLYRTPLVRYETNLQENRGVEDLLAQLALALPFEGDIIECGSSRCGGSVLMALAVRAAGEKKTILACDSFEGFDRSEWRTERERGLTTAREDAFTSTSYGYVVRKLRVLGVDDLVKPVRGYFVDTLPHLAGPWCFALVDCDLMQSILYCAEQLWPKIVPGGRIVFDDYTCADFRGARLGIEEFVRRCGPEIAEHGLLRRLYFARKR